MSICSCKNTSTFSLVTFIVPRDGFVNTVLIIATGFGLPLILSGIGLGATFNYYGKQGCHCFCNLTSPQAWGYIVPLGFWAFAVGIAAEAAAGEKYKQLHDTEHTHYIQANINRRGVVYCMMFSLGVYLFGLIAVHTQNIVLYILLFVFALILGPVIFVFHTMCDKVVSTAFNRKAPMLPWYKKYLFTMDDKKKMAEGHIVDPADDGENGFRDFYKWVTDGRRDVDAAKESEDVLFNKVPKASATQ